jgi:hypothetical protein
MLRNKIIKKKLKKRYKQAIKKITTKLDKNK